MLEVRFDSDLQFQSPHGMVWYLLIIGMTTICFSVWLALCRFQITFTYIYYHNWFFLKTTEIGLEGWISDVTAFQTVLFKSFMLFDSLCEYTLSEWNFIFKKLGCQRLKVSYLGKHLKVVEWNRTYIHLIFIEIYFSPFYLSTFIRTLRFASLLGPTVRVSF